MAVWAPIPPSVQKGVLGSSYARSCITPVQMRQERGGIPPAVGPRTCTLLPRRIDIHAPAWKRATPKREKR